MLPSSARLDGGVQGVLGSRNFRPSLSGGVASTREPVEGSRELLDLALGRTAAARSGGGNNVEGGPLTVPE
jgi:hypothetical protein